MINFCAACTMPLEDTKNIGATLEGKTFCIHCVNADGQVKSCEEIFQGGVDFFLSTFSDLDRKFAERITRTNMSNLPYWQDKKHECLEGEMATKEEFQAILARLQS